MIQIDEMTLRLPDMPQEDASRLGREVAQLVADSLPVDVGNANIPELQIKINAGSFSPGTSMATTIAEQIVRQIRMYSL